MTPVYPVGKLPQETLERLLRRAPLLDRRVLLGPGIGLDCAVVEYPDRYLVFKSDPITFATDQIGWYAVQVNVNDIATTGATPRWMLATLLLPEGKATQALVETIYDQIYDACKDLGISVIGGHTEITYGIERPIVAATMIGEVDKDKLVKPNSARPGDHLLLTKGIPIEATAILAREFSVKLADILGSEVLRRAQNFLYEPGISVLRDAQIATQAGRVNAMHDPTEGGLAAALWELAEASQVSILIDPASVPVFELSRRICQTFDLDPLGAIASGALLLTAPPDHAPRIRQALEEHGIACSVIGRIGEAPVVVRQNLPEGEAILRRPERDEIARLFE